MISMGKTFLLELTEKEVDVLQNALIREKFFWGRKGQEEASSTTIDNNINTCDSVLNKLEKSFQKQSTILITAKDLFFIKSLANDEYRRLPSNTKLSGKEVEQKDLVHISVANALISWFNSKDILKRLVRFDNTDDSFDYESNE